MLPDALGFKYPKVNIDKCVECGLCDKVCAFNAEYDKSLNLSKPFAYAARHKNIKEIESSRSGAAFIAISDIIIEKGGIIYGAGYKDHFVVTHKRATTKTERNEFKGSKYSQSDLGSMFSSIKQDLKEGKIVLFSGTPCQTAGLNAFIGKKFRDHLFLLDIICHGVPSPIVWKDYLHYLENKYNSKIIKVNFRDKKYGWDSSFETFTLENGKEIKLNQYNFLFSTNIMLRRSCYNCPFSNTLRPSDITIGDFWGWEKVVPSFNNDNKGVSLILVNTIKGYNLFNLAQTKLNTIPVNLEDCLQPNLKKPTQPHSKYTQFYTDFQRLEISQIFKKFGNTGIIYQLKHSAIKLIGNKAKIRIKKILNI